MVHFLSQLVSAGTRTKQTSQPHIQSSTNNSNLYIYILNRGYSRMLLCIFKILEKGKLPNPNPPLERVQSVTTDGKQDRDGALSTLKRGGRFPAADLGHEH